MSDIEFHRTVMGHRFYEATMPELVRQITRLNGLLEKLVERLPETAPAPAPAPPPASPAPADSTAPEAPR